MEPASGASHVRHWDQRSAGVCAAARTDARGNGAQVGLFTDGTPGAGGVASAQPAEGWHYDTATPRQLVVGQSKDR